MPNTHFSLCLRGREAIYIFKAPLKIFQITQLLVYNQHLIPPSIFQKILQSHIIENTEKNPTSGDQHCQHVFLKYVI